MTTVEFGIYKTLVSAPLGKKGEYMDSTKYPPLKIGSLVWLDSERDGQVYFHVLPPTVPEVGYMILIPVDLLDQCVEPLYTGDMKIALVEHPDRHGGV